MRSTARCGSTRPSSPPWDAMTFVAGKGDLHEVKLLNHATAISGETPATAKVDLNSREPKYGIDYFHVFFRDTRYTVTTTDARAETTLTAPVGNDQPGEVWMPVGSTDGFETGDWIYIEKTGANKEFVYATKWITAAIRSRRTSRLPTLRAATFRSRPEAALSRRKWQS